MHVPLCMRASVTAAPHRTLVRMGSHCYYHYYYYYCYYYCYIYIYRYCIKEYWDKSTHRTVVQMGSRDSPGRREAADGKAGNRSAAWDLGT